MAAFAGPKPAKWTHRPKSELRQNDDSFVPSDGNGPLRSLVSRIISTICERSLDVDSNVILRYCLLNFAEGNSWCLKRDTLSVWSALCCSRRARDLRSNLRQFPLSLPQMRHRYPRLHRFRAITLFK